MTMYLQGRLRSNVPSGGGGDPLIPAPDLSTVGATTVGFADNLKSLLSASSPGQKFYFPAGTYTNIEDAKPKQGQSFIGESGTIIDGGGTRARAFIGDNDDVLFAKLTFQNYDGSPNGSGNPAQNVAVIDPKKGNWDEGSAANAHDWRIHDCTFLGSLNVAIIMAHRFIVDECSFAGHNPHAIGGGFGTGGVIKDCTFKDNGYTGASGDSANASQVKLAFWNVGPWGQTDRDTSRFRTFNGGAFTSDMHNYEPPATLIVTGNTFDGVRDTGTYGAGDNSRALWFDLDCRDIDVYGNTFTDCKKFGIFFEGCNGARVFDNQFTNHDSLVNILGTGTWTNRYWGNAAVAADCSDNIDVFENTFTDCVGCIIFFLGDRGGTGADWGSSGGYATSSKGFMIRNITTPIAIGEASTVGASRCKARDNSLEGSSYGVGFLADEDMNLSADGNLSTYTFTGNTYPGGTFRNFMSSLRYTSLGAWQSAGFDS